MLAADKLELTSLIKKNATALKGKELELNQSNFEAVGTQAAVLAGFAVCMLAKIDVPDSINPVLMALYYAFAVVNLMGNLACVSVVASVNILGTSLGLRGPDGSMRQAADGMHQQRTRIFWCFGTAMVSCSGAVITLAWIKMQPFAALACSAILFWGLVSGAKGALQMKIAFRYRDHEAVKVDDMLSSDTVGTEAFVKQLGVDCDTLAQLLVNIRQRRHDAKLPPV
ncbi:unnamed protein product [Durusdinium trenchii]|uniref:Uncharacterized protein n=2 Tax=Durusdinium trenchii TaxID=1381693 RepID=A0ABP0LGW9_9DINO